MAWMFLVIGLLAVVSGVIAAVRMLRMDDDGKAIDLARLELAERHPNRSERRAAFAQLPRETRKRLARLEAERAEILARISRMERAKEGV